MCDTYIKHKFDDNIELKENAMLKVKPELFYEWDFEKNDELGLDIYKATKGQGIKAWWICSKGHKWDAIIGNRVNLSSGCPYCSHHKVGRNNSLVSLSNSLSSLKPKLSKQWHPTKNGDLTPSDFACRSNKKVWWFGKCGHEWEAIINDRARGRGCPYCASQKILVGFNDMWTTNPELASLLANPDDGYKYMQGSSQKVDWKCPDCGNVIKNRVISSINKHGLSCITCSNKISFPEKLMGNLLNFLNIEYETQFISPWSNNRRYDFYLPNYSMIIETHGKQHYEKSDRGRSLEEEQENDRYKMALAKINNIEHYIVIDCRYSDFEYIKNNILNSKLNELLNLCDVDWNKISYLISKSLIKNVSEMYKNDMSILEISSITKLNSNKIKDYLKIGIHDFDIRETYNCSGMKKEVVRINDGLYFNSLTEASKITKISKTSISNNLNKRSSSAGGYKWMYKEDYEKYIKERKQLA